MSIHFQDRQRLQNFLGRYKKGGLERANILHKVMKFLDPIKPGGLADTLPAFETTFHKCFNLFHSSENPLKNGRLAVATASLGKTLAKLESNDRRIWILVAEYLLTTLPPHKDQENHDEKANLQSAIFRTKIISSVPMTS